MARYIQVASIGGAAPGYDPGEAGADRLLANFFEEKLEPVLPDCPDLIIFPEMCDFSARATMADNLERVKTCGDAILKFMRGVARANRAFVAYPTARVLETGKLAQSIYFIGRDGMILAIYDKHYLTFGEMEAFQRGKGALVVDCELGKVGFILCFDLNFSDLCEQYSARGVNLLLFASAFHGGLMQRYWAYACQAYLIGSVYGLPCTILAPDGEVSAVSTYYHFFVTQRINMDYGVFHLDFNWEKIRAAKRKYGSALLVHDSGLSGSVVMYAPTDACTIPYIAAEFGLEPLAQYIRRAHAAQQG
jgi:predicted amidohydrolase